MECFSFSSIFIDWAFNIKQDLTKLYLTYYWIILRKIYFRKSSNSASRIKTVEFGRPSSISNIGSLLCSSKNSRYNTRLCISDHPTFRTTRRPFHYPLLRTTPTSPLCSTTAVHTMIAVLCTTHVIVKTDTVNMPIHIHLESSNTALVVKCLMN